MGITGSIIVYVMIWWIIFFSVLPIGIQSNKEVFREKTGKKPFTNINIERI